MYSSALTASSSTTITLAATLLRLVLIVLSPLLCYHLSHMSPTVTGRESRGRDGSSGTSWGNEAEVGYIVELLQRLAAVTKKGALRRGIGIIAPVSVLHTTSVLLCCTV
jgi:hypothetical protein